MNYTGSMNRNDAELYMQTIKDKYEAKKQKEIENFLSRMKIVGPEPEPEPKQEPKQELQQEPELENPTNKGKPKVPTVDGNKLSFMPKKFDVPVTPKQSLENKSFSKPVVLGGIRGKFINEDIITAKSKQRKNPPKFKVAIGEDEDGKVITKDYASQKSRIWGEFRKIEFGRYKEQYKEAGRVPYWSEFQKLCSAVWGSLSDDEKQDMVLNGSDIDWINL